MLIEELKLRQKELESIASRAGENLSTAPEGSVRVSVSRGMARFYQIDEGTSSLGKYIPVESVELVESLSQKEYDERVLHLARQQAKAIDNLLNNRRWGLANYSITGILKKMHSCKKRLVRPYELSDEEYARQWQEEEYEGKGFEESASVLVTARHERVRSKSELIIANTLQRENIPYHYEKPICLESGVTCYPDFTVLNRRTRQEFIWEHFGMMDDEGYCERALRKLDLYEESGIFPRIGLIMTWETRRRPLGSISIERNVNAYLK